jgi:hypothetical protein
MSLSHHTARAHHHPGHGHPPAPAGASLLRLSAWQRLSLAAGFSALIWLAVYWAMR